MSRLIKVPMIYTDNQLSELGVDSGGVVDTYVFLDQIIGFHDDGNNITGLHLPYGCVQVNCNISEFINLVTENKN